MYLAWLKGWQWWVVQDGRLQTPVIPHPLLFLFSALSPGSLKLEVLNQAVGLRGKACLSLWNFIIFNYLDHDGSLSPLLPVPPFHLVTQTQASLAQPCFLSFCLSGPLLPSLPCAASPLLIMPITIFFYLMPLFFSCSLFPTGSFFHTELDNSLKGKIDIINSHHLWVLHDSYLLYALLLYRSLKYRQDAQMFCPSVLCFIYIYHGLLWEILRKNKIRKLPVVWLV